MRVLVLGKSTPVGLTGLVPVHTDRLSIRPFREDDASALYELHKSPKVTRYAGGTKTREQSYEALQKVIQRVRTTGFGALAIAELSNGRVIGWCGLQLMKDIEEFEITYGLSADKWGQGLAYEAAFAMLSLAFGCLGFDEVYGLVFPQNTRSIRVLEKLGMRFVRKHLDLTTQQDASLYVTNNERFSKNQSSSK